MSPRFPKNSKKTKTTIGNVNNEDTLTGILIVFLKIIEFICKYILKDSRS